MNRSGKVGYLNWNIVYVVVVLLFAIGAAKVIGDYRNNALLAEDFYAKEIAKVINLAESGTEVKLDVSEATKIAEKNGVQSFSEIFMFDNTNKEVIVSLKPGSASAFSFFNNVTVFEPKIELAKGENLETNLLIFKVK